MSSCCRLLPACLNVFATGDGEKQRQIADRTFLSFTVLLLTKSFAASNCVPTVPNFEHFPFHLPIWQPYLNDVFGCTRTRLSAPTKFSFVVDGDQQSNRPVLRVRIYQPGAILSLPSATFVSSRPHVALRPRNGYDSRPRRKMTFWHLWHWNPPTSHGGLGKLSPCKVAQMSEGWMMKLQLPRIALIGGSELFRDFERNRNLL